MPNQQQTLDEILDNLDVSVKGKLEKILANITPQQRLQVIQNPDLIDQLLSEFDPDKLAEYYQTQLYRMAQEVAIDFSEKIDTGQKTKVNTFVDTLVKLKTKTLRNYLISNKETFANNLIQLIINGSNQETVKSYFKSTPFKNYQIGTLLNTARSEIRRTISIAGFEDDNTVKYRYVGDIIEHSSKICIWLLKHQKPEGYTLEEIQAGIVTPFGKVDFGGRIPNYNCIHEWELIEGGY